MPPRASRSISLSSNVPDGDEEAAEENDLDRRRAVATGADLSVMTPTERRVWLAGVLFDEERDRIIAALNRARDAVKSLGAELMEIDRRREAYVACGRTEERGAFAQAERVA